MVRVAPFRNPLISLIAFLALIELNLAVAVILQEKRVNDDYSQTTALLAFAGTLTFCLAPFQVIAAKSWPTGRFARVSWDVLLTFLFFVFHFAGAAAMSDQILYQPSHEPFVRTGSLGLLAVSWINTFVLFLVLSTTCTFFIRRWAGWEDGVSKMPAKQLWDEGYWGGGAVKKEAQEAWREKRAKASREVAEQWRRDQAEVQEREEAGKKGKAPAKRAPGHDEVVVVIHPATMSTDSGFSQYAAAVH